MKTLTLELALDESARHPLHEFVTTHDAYGPTRLRQWNPQAAASALLFYVDGPREPFLSRLADVPTTEFVEAAPAPGRDGFFLFVSERLDDTDRRLVDAYADEDVVVVPPVVYDVTGDVHLSVVGTADALQRAVDRTPEAVDLSVSRIRSGGVDHGVVGDALTDRQREVVAAARAAGYYADPREATVEDVAERTDCAPSTVAEHLRRAEASLVERATVDPPQD